MDDPNVLEIWNLVFIQVRDFPNTLNPRTETLNMEDPNVLDTWNLALIRWGSPNRKGNRDALLPSLTHQELESAGIIVPVDGAALKSRAQLCDYPKSNVLLLSPANLILTRCNAHSVL